MSSLCKVILTFEVLCLVATFLFTLLLVNPYSSAALDSLSHEYPIIYLWQAPVKRQDRCLESEPCFTWNVLYNCTAINFKTAEQSI